MNELTTAVNAAPMTTATASSTTFPRSRKSLKPLSTFVSNSHPSVAGATLRSPVITVGRG